MAPPPPVSGGSAGLLGGLLRDVSRSFYLSLRLLPKPVRPQIGLAYLLARATDTIADTRIVPRGDRLETLGRLRERIRGTDTRPVGVESLIQGQSSEAEATLLRRIEEALGLLGTLGSSDLALVRGVLETITSGQELDLRRFPEEPAGVVHSLVSMEELWDYTHRVAGCVGAFWTRICFAHLPHPPGCDVERMVRLGLGYGQGLQLVNILRDIPADLKMGRCYVPSEEMVPLGLRPADLTMPENELKFRPLHLRLSRLAEGRLRDGWDYTLELPRGWWRVRVACALPVLIGRRTLRLLAGSKVLNPSSRVKVPRQEVRGMLARVLLCAPFPKRMARLWDTAPGQG